MSLTTVFGLRKFDSGEPARNTATIINQHADLLEAALIRGGVVAPGVTDLATLSAQVRPGTWQPMILGPGWGRYESEVYPPLGYRLENGRVFLRGWLTTTAAKAAGAAVLATTAGGSTVAFVPTTYRPTYQHTLIADDASSALAGVKWRMQIYPDGNLYTFSAIPSGVSIWLGGMSWPVAG